MAAIKGNVTIYVNGKSVVLKDSAIGQSGGDYLADGGEGRLYLKNDVIYKIYHEINKMIPEAKVRELQSISQPNVIVPVDLIFNKQQQIIGFTMRKANGYELCRLFNTIFLTDNHITPEMLGKLVDNTRDTWNHIHEKDCLIGDGNECNFLVSNKDQTNMIFIDTNAYGTKSFKCDAYTPIFSDPTTKGFTRLTDWFTFAILACKIFIGMHPFKGVHEGYYAKDTIKRMIDKKSIFNPRTKVPQAARDFSYIPHEYLKWFIQLFEEGKRCPPPAIGGIICPIQVKKQLTQTVGAFIKEFVMKISENIKKVHTFRGKLYPIPVSMNEILVFSPKTGTEIKLRLENGSLISCNSNMNINMSTISADQYMIKDNRFYLIKGDIFASVKINELPNRIIMSMGTSWNIPVNAAKIFSGVIHANLYNKNWFFVPFVKNESDLCLIRQIKEIDGYKVVYARCERNILVVITEKNSVYDRFVIKLDFASDNYIIRASYDVSYPYINFTVLDNGVTVLMDENGDIEVFFANLKKDSVTKLTNGGLENDMILFNDGLNVMYYRENEIFKISMKKQLTLVIRCDTL